MLFPKARITNEFTPGLQSQDTVDKYYSPSPHSNKKKPPGLGPDGFP